MNKKCCFMAIQDLQLSQKPGMVVDIIPTLQVRDRRESLRIGLTFSKGWHWEFNPSVA